ncbi:hypothetical protein ACROYT_G023346 [Oculina patagonica]
MKTTVSSTDNYAGCKGKDCKEVPAFGRFVVDGRIKTCFRSLTEHSPWLMIHLNDYYPISLVRITTSAISLKNVKVFVGDNNKTTHASGNNLPLCAYYEGMIQRNRLVSFGCDQLYTYGNVVKLVTESSILNLCEVEVYADPYVNIALKQFSEPKSRHSYLANDGDLGTSFKGSYWYLELGAKVRVSVVFILHERSTNLEGFDIEVGKDNKKDLCTTIPKYSSQQDQGNYFECKRAVVGSFLNITLKRGTPRQISLYEVEVFQTKTINLAAKRPTDSSANQGAAHKGNDQKISETVSISGVSWIEWWSVDLKAICKVHLVRVVASEKYKPANLKVNVKVNVDAGFNKGKKVASLDNPTKEPVQTITLPEDTKARYVTIELKDRGTWAELKFREVEIYNGPFLDVNECDNPGVKCPRDFRCQNGPNSYTYIDECLSNPCHVKASCSNTHGSFNCTCKAGFAGDGRNVCSDVDECEEKTYSCPKFSTCKNKDGGYECQCKHGYKKTSKGACSEICVPKCDKDSYCENGKCLCRKGLDSNCQAGLLGSGISHQSSAALLKATSPQSSFTLLAGALLWCLPLM